MEASERNGKPGSECVGGRFAAESAPSGRPEIPQQPQPEFAKPAHKLRQKLIGRTVAAVRQRSVAALEAEQLVGVHTKTDRRYKHFVERGNTCLPQVNGLANRRRK